ncbi:MAG: hypothetical protein AAB600_01565 [Patescibacteria group bacterium]
MKKLEVYVVDAFLILFAFLFFNKSQFVESLTSLILLVVLLKIDEVKKLQKETQQELELLKQSVLYQSFQGELAGEKNKEKDQTKA